MLSAMSAHQKPGFRAAAAMASAAEHILERRATYALGGRGPGAFDGFGFVRCAAQMVFTAMSQAYRAADRTLLDMPLAAYPTRIPAGGTTPADAVSIEPEANYLRIVLAEAGMVEAPGGRDAVTHAGDVVLYVGNGPAGSIVLRGKGDRQGERLALCWKTGPHIEREPIWGRHRVRVYRWPEASL